MALLDFINSIVRPYHYNKVAQGVYDARMMLKEFKSRGLIKFVGGEDSVYPLRDAKLDTAANAMYDGAIGSTITPALVETINGINAVDAWGYWTTHVSVDHKQWTKAGGSHAKAQNIVPLFKEKEIELGDWISDALEYQIFSGDGTGNNIDGFEELFDITNNDYFGLDLATAQGPSQVTLTGNMTTLSIADLFEAVTNIEDEGRFPDLIVAYPDVIQKLRTLAQTATDFTQGGGINWGHKKHDLLDTRIMPSRYMPNTSGASTRIYFFNFGNDVGSGITGDDKSDHGKFWHLEMGEDSPGWDVGDWERVQLRGKVFVKMATGALKCVCSNPIRQAYIKVA